MGRAGALRLSHGRFAFLAIIARHQALSAIAPRSTWLNRRGILPLSSVDRPIEGAMSDQDDRDALSVRRRDGLIHEGLIGDLRRTTPGHRRPIHHSHGDVELNLIVRGAAIIAMDGHAYQLRPGALMWILPDKVHKLVRGPQLEMWVVMFREDLFDAPWLEDLAAQPSRLTTAEELLSLDRLFSEVAQDSDEPTTYNAGIRYVLMRSLRASQARPAAALKPVHPAVARAVKLLRENGSGESLTGLAKAAGVTPHYLSRLLSEQTGRSFVDWRNRVRLDRFFEGYRPGANLLAAALDAGFGSYSRFHHTFSELVGCTPKAWATQVDEGKRAPQAATAAPAARTGFGLHEGGALLSARQRWAWMVSLASPRIADLLGEAFAHRLGDALPSEHGAAWLTTDVQPLSLSATEIEDLVASFVQADPESAVEYGRLLLTHDVTRIYTRLCESYEVTPQHLSQAIANLILMAWAAARPDSIVAAHHAAVRRQVNGALRSVTRLDPALARRGFVAVVCHFAVLHEAAVAARAAGDPRHLDQLDRAAREWSHAVFGGDVRQLELFDDGLRPAAPMTPTRQARAAMRLHS
jgi:methylphosphotriester-DNA--protein-cysteine methyltransferase